MRLVVCTVGGWHRAWGLPASVYVGKTWISGGERTLYELAAAGAAAGLDVELRGDLHRAALDQVCRAAGAAPRVGMAPRLPAADDLVIVPEGWTDPFEYARIALSPARAVIMLLAAPGLFGWSFLDDWSPPDPLTVDPAAVGRPASYRAMAASGFELWTHSSTMAAEAEDAGVPCTLLGGGSPLTLPDPPEKDVDVAVIASNRWYPLAEHALRAMDATSIVIPEVPHRILLEHLGRARILLWPSRIEGTSRIQTEARALGTVPVALRSNRYAEGLDEGGGAVLVDRPEDIAPAAAELLADPDRLELLSKRAIRTARDRMAWAPHVAKVAEVAGAPAPVDPVRGARGVAGEIVGRLLDDAEQHARRDVEEARGRSAAFHRRRAVMAGTAVGDLLSRVVGRR